jgi:thymidine kinase
MKSVSATQGRTIASSAAAEPLARGGNEGAPAGSEQQQQQQQHGAIEIVVGPMFAGKTTELLRRVAGYEAAGLSVAVVKSNKDDRYCAANVVTHDGLRRVGAGRAALYA